MPSTKVVIVYSPTQARRRTVIIPDNDEQVLIHTRNISFGEKAFIGSLEEYKRIGPDAMLRNYLGRDSLPDHCAVVNNEGIVVTVVAGDPVIDKHPDGQLYHDPFKQAVIGEPVGDLSIPPPSASG